MRRFFLGVLAASILVVVSTFAGMAVFGMKADAMGMTHEACVGADCGMHHDAADTDCLSHCLSSATPAATTSAPVTIASVLLVCAAFIASQAATRADRSRPLVSRWREGIGKRLSHRQLATVLILD